MNFYTYLCEIDDDILGADHMDYLDIRFDKTIMMNDYVLCNRKTKTSRIYRSVYEKKKVRMCIYEKIISFGDGIRHSTSLPKYFLHNLFPL